MYLEILKTYLCFCIIYAVSFRNLHYNYATDCYQTREKHYFAFFFWKYYQFISLKRYFWEDDNFGGILSGLRANKQWLIFIALVTRLNETNKSY